MKINVYIFLTKYVVTSSLFSISLRNVVTISTLAKLEIAPGRPTTYLIPNCYGERYLARWFPTLFNAFVLCTFLKPLIPAFSN